MSLKESSSNLNQSETNLNRWLVRKELLANPFERWNAEYDHDLPNYFVDIGDFDNVLNLSEPCFIFARRGCGKTAQRQMLAAQYRPTKSDSSELAIHYTYTGFEQVLTQVNDDPDQVKAIHHVRAIIQLGMEALFAETQRDTKLKKALSKPIVGSNMDAFMGRFVPHLSPSSKTATPDGLDNLGPLALLQGFANLVKGVGLKTCVVLVDGLDEFPLTANDPIQIATFLEPLAGTLPLIECPGVAFKFFLPQDIEKILRECDWFRPDRLRFFRLAWKEQDLLRLLEQRLTFFSQRQPPYEALGQLCEDKLAQVIDKEFVKIAEGLPRAALSLAGTLLQYHCEQPDPPDLIPLVTWGRVKDDWPGLRGDFMVLQQHQPMLRVEEGKNLVWLGDKDITSEINSQEYNVLACLYRYKDGLCTKDTLDEEAWDEYASDETIAQSIRRLRKALKKHSPHIEYIETVRGRGYRLYPDGFME